MRSALSLKRFLIAGLTAVLLGGVMLGVALAQPPVPGGPRSERHEQFLNALADELDISPERLREAIQKVHEEQGYPDHDPEGPGGPGGPGHHPKGFGGHFLRIAAEELGMTPQELRQELADGKSITDVANDEGVDPDDVEDALRDDAYARIDRAVEKGRLTEEQAEEARDRADEKIEELMTRTWERPEHGGPHDDHGGPHDNEDE